MRSAALLRPRVLPRRSPLRSAEPSSSPNGARHAMPSTGRSLFEAARWLSSTELRIRNNRWPACSSLRSPTAVAGPITGSSVDGRVLAARKLATSVASSTGSTYRLRRSWAWRIASTCTWVSGDGRSPFIVPLRAAAIRVRAASAEWPRCTCQIPTTVPVRPTPPQQCTNTFRPAARAPSISAMIRS